MMCSHVMNVGKLLPRELAFDGTCSLQLGYSKEPISREYQSKGNIGNWTLTLEFCSIH